MGKFKPKWKLKIDRIEVVPLGKPYTKPEIRAWQDEVKTLRRLVSKKKDWLILILIIFGLVSAWLLIIIPQLLLLKNTTDSDLRTPTRMSARHQYSLESVPIPVKDSKKATCIFPKIDIFNEEVKPFLKRHSRIVCPMEKYKLFKVDHLGRLMRLRDTSKFSLLNCCYRQLVRKTDFKTTIAVDCHNITGNVTVVDNSFHYIGIQCFNNKTKKVQFVDMFPMTHVKEEKKPAVKRGQERPKVNVIIVGIDATSHLNFKRLLPQTFKYIAKSMSGIGLQWLNKVGDNTMPNMLGTLIGIKLSDVIKRCWKNTKKSFFDSCPYIWQRYSREGYLTAYGEDIASISTHNYGKQGFKLPPTDYYLRPVTILQEKHIRSNWKEHLPQCFGPRTPTAIVLEFLERLTQAMEENDRNYFQFMWTSAMTHGSMSQGTQLDQTFVSTLKFLHKGKYLNNTVFILMSDHGFRFGGYRNTYYGDIEARMPFAYFVLPTWFKKQYPTALKNFKTNAEGRLTTFFDIYKTLKDLLFLDWSVKEDRVKQRSRTLDSSSEIPRAISLFLPIPTSRTCDNADIPKQFCICSALPKIRNLTHPLLQSSSAFFVQRVNAEIVLRNLNKANCAKLALAKVVSAKGDLSGKDNEFLHTITIMTVPGNATFEATMTTRKNSTAEINTTPSRKKRGIWWSFDSNQEDRVMSQQHEWQVVGEIIRTNSFKNQSYCVNDTILKQFCYCES